MARVTCAAVRDSAAEFALGILPSEERAALARHLVECPECRREVDGLTTVGDDLLALVPDAEPPLGFERRVLAAVRRPRRRATRTWVTAGAGVAAAAAAISLAVVHTGSGSHYVTAALRSDGRVIGSVRTEGHPSWIWMNVDHSSLSGRVTCDLVESNGTVLEIGSFDVVDGSGSWGAPEPAATGRVVGAQLVASDGQVIATATFTA